LLLLAACQGGGPSPSSAPESEAGEPSAAPSEAAQVETLTPGVLTVAVPHFPYPGYIEGEDPTAPTEGYYVSMMEEVADQLGLEIEYISADFTAMMAQQFNDYDIMMTTLSITPERQETFDMTTPVTEFYEGIMVREGTSVATADEIRALKLGVCGTCALFTFITDVIQPTVEPAALAEDLQKYDALATGQIDGALGDLLVIMSKSQEPNYEGLVAGCKFEPPSQAAWLLPKGHDATDEVNAIIQGMWDDGTLDELNEQFIVPLAGGGDPSAVPACPSFD
jgi:ABC-type amino acid transport substrate-binding protein